ncbi:MAG TPA: hypothetical protein VKY65_11890 [Alphaproteobacteria bacterium]|nr:hypothetical protein [Alphaproteobacteria bacterium]
MTLFSTFLRPGHRAAAPVESSNLLPWYAFDAAIERSLRMLRGVHVPVSLFAIHLGGPSRHEATEAIGEALNRFGPVGRLADGGIGLLYLGPRATDESGDEALTNHLHSRVVRRLRESGWTALTRHMEFTAVHGWTDEMASSADLVAELARRRGKPAAGRGKH